MKDLILTILRQRGYMNFSGIRQSLENIDYAWNKPQTYLVLVPGLSLIIKNIQLAEVLPLPPINNVILISPNEAIQLEASSRKFATICKWHFGGSIIQMIACAVATKTFAVPFFQC